jgi:hypothetical protein
MVLAAPAAQETTTISGTVVTLAKETDFNGVTTVLVTVQDDMGVQQTYRISVDTAVSLGLATVDSLTNEVTLADLTVPITVTIDPTTVIADEEPFNPVAALLASFFDVSPTAINQYHEAGYGFGVIAQALWMSRDSSTGLTDTTLAGDILRVKQSKDYTQFFTDHPEYTDLYGDNMPTNWGQFKKLLLDKKNNLGAVVSQHGQSGDDSTDVNALQGPGNGKGNGRGNGNGHGNGNGNRP